MLAGQKYELVTVGDHKPHPLNPRKGDTEAITESIEENGFFGAVLAQKSRKRILAGEHRWKAAKAQGEKKIPVIWIDVDDDRARKILLADDKTQDMATYDESALLSPWTTSARTPPPSPVPDTAWTSTRTCSPATARCPPHPQRRRSPSTPRPRPRRKSASAISAPGTRSRRGCVSWFSSCRWRRTPELGTRSWGLRLARKDMDSEAKKGYGDEVTG